MHGQPHIKLICDSPASDPRIFSAERKKEGRIKKENRRNVGKEVGRKPKGKQENKKDKERTSLILFGSEKICEEFDSE